MLGKVGAIFHQCHQGAGTSWPRSHWGLPGLEPGPQGGCLGMWPPPFHWGETLPGHRAIVQRALPSLCPSTLPA